MCLLGHFCGVELLASSLEPVEQGLSRGEAQRSDCHSQTTIAHDVLKLLSDALQDRASNPLSNAPE